MQKRDKIDPDWHWSGYAAATVGLIVLAAVVLLLMGRTMWGEAPGFGLWTGDTGGNLNSQLLADPYSVSHVSHGLVFFMILWAIAGQKLVAEVRLLIAVLVEGLWEILENTPMVIQRFREDAMNQGYFGDSVLNSVGDILAMVLGFWLAMKLPKVRWVLVTFIALEVALYLWIGDNMTRNIIVLL